MDFFFLVSGEWEICSQNTSNVFWEEISHSPATKNRKNQSKTSNFRIRFFPCIANVVLSLGLSGFLSGVSFWMRKKIHKTNKAILHLLKNFNGVNRYSWIFALISSNNPSHRATLRDWISAVRRSLMKSRPMLDSRRSSSLISGKFYGPGVDFGCL